MSNKAQMVNNSPCIRNCCLDECDICLGCFRHIDEIVAWRSYSDKEREQVVAECQQRQDDKSSTT